MRLGVRRLPAGEKQSRAEVPTDERQCAETVERGGREQIMGQIADVDIREQPEERHFLGVSLRRNPEDGTVEVFLSKRSKERIDARIRELTPRAWGQSLRGCIAAVNTYLRGWLNFFGTGCTDAVVRTLHNLDAL